MCISHRRANFTNNPTGPFPPSLSLTLMPAQLASSEGSSGVDACDVPWTHTESFVNDRVTNRDRNTAFSEGKGRLILSASPFAWRDV
ncbi:hypothetical protein K439DRAFT_1631268, partial [Ramaria rubella]